MVPSSFDSLTDEWCDMVEAASEEELRESPFFRLAWTIGPPGGVMLTERSAKCMGTIGRANGATDADIAAWWRKIDQ